MQSNDTTALTVTVALLGTVGQLLATVSLPAQFRLADLELFRDALGACRAEVRP
ncbi:hypothetical protein [Methylobacterium hispanicum]|uniref:hypothetical protein n=1 Tax=Methylobacterium hispanicum TaxID=270350 RepID=UPI002F35D463